MTFISLRGLEGVETGCCTILCSWEFVTILGYEWSGNTPAGGDHNVYYFDESIPIHRSSHWHLEDKSDEENDRYPIKELYDELEIRMHLLFHILVAGELFWII